MTRIAACAFAIGLVAAARPASAQVPVLEETPPPRSDDWQLAAGARNMLIRSAGFDPFSSDDHLAQFSAWASRVITRSGALGVAVGLGLDAGSASATARGAATDLTLSRYVVFGEARYNLHPRFYGFARLAPGFLHGSARLRETSAPLGGRLGDSFTSFALDASAGGAFCVTGSKTRVGAWLLAEAGYGYAPEHRLMLAPELADRDQNKAAALDLGPLAARGMLLRFAFALSY